MTTLDFASRELNEPGIEIIDAASVGPPLATFANVEIPATINLAGVVEMILKRPDQLERVIREPHLQSQLVPRLLAISLLGFVFFGAALSLVFTAAGHWPRLSPMKSLVAGENASLVVFEPQSPGESHLTRWRNGSAAALIGAYAIGLIAATGVCLPSLYFYALLAGVKMSAADVVLHALKSKATGAVALIGILPIYAALGLGIVIFDVPEAVRYGAFWLGLVLPFLAGLFGTYSLCRGFQGLADTFSREHRHRRETFLRLLVLSWGACYTAVTPVMIHTLWVLFARIV